MTCETRNAIIIHHPQHDLSPPMLVHCQEEDIFCIDLPQSCFIHSLYFPSFLDSNQYLLVSVSLTFYGFETKMSRYILLSSSIFPKFLGYFHPNILQTSALQCGFLTYFSHIYSYFFQILQTIFVVQSFLKKIIVHPIVQCALQCNPL